MDDDLLADDGQYKLHFNWKSAASFMKDDGLDDLDIDAEAALLGLSDEEVDESRSTNDDQELEYVDEEGNPVSIGENNADLYEVANIDSNKLSNAPDEDVLELDLDAELDSFNQETTDLLRDESPAPTKSYNERQRKDNLISLTKRKDQERPPLKRRESRYSPVEEQDRSSKDASFSNQSISRVDHRDSYGDEMEYDEESEDESIADDHRERFKSERSNIITLTPAKRRADIPDTLESVISVEETAKVQAFLENEQKRKMRFRGNSRGRQPRFQRPNQNYQSPQVQQSPQFSSAPATSLNQTTSTAPQSRKILINPHFRGVRLPPANEQIHAVNETPQVSMPPSSYDNTNYAPPPVQYSHPEPVHSVNVAPPPIYTAPPPAVQYKPPEYAPPPPQQHMQQMPPPMWQPPDMTVPSYSNPPPIQNYGDPVPQAPSYNNYNQNYSNMNYQNPPPMPMPQSMNYSQPPPPVHHHSQSFQQPPVIPPSSNITHPQYAPPASNPVRMQQMQMQPHSYQEPVPMSRPPMVSQHTPRGRFPQNHQNQRFSRPPEKRVSNINMKHMPMKQARMEHPQRKYHMYALQTNVHVNSSNIREIPLVDNLPKVRKTSAIKVVPIVEDEDEKTKELRMKIEEQKLLREQILKRKEERRRQMASQRLVEMKIRQAEQNKNIVTIVQKGVNQNNRLKVAPAAKPALKPSIKERIGLPLNKTAPITKKKIVVVRKKVPQNTANTTVPNTATSPAIVGQRLKFPVPTQKQNIQQFSKPVIIATSVQKLGKNKPNSNVKPPTIQLSKPAAPPKIVQTKIVAASAATPKSGQSTPSKKVFFTSQRGKFNRPGNRPNFQQRPQQQRQQQRPQQFQQQQRMQRPRAPSPRGSQFPPSPLFMEHRMPFPSQGPPMHDIRMPPPHHFQEPRPPLIPFHPHREPGPGSFNHFFPHDRPFEQNNPHFRMRGPNPGPGPGPVPNLPNFRPRGMEPMFQDRFPPPQFANQMPQMRPRFENNMQRFSRQRFHHHQGKQRFPANNAHNLNQKQTNVSKVVERSTPVATASQMQNMNQKPNDGASKSVEEKQISKVVVVTRKIVPDDMDVSKTQSVSVENLSSSTSEAQLKKLCSSVGVVENIQLIKSERKAVIKFKEPRQALCFQKKYQRYMLDLAMIRVSLLSA